MASSPSPGHTVDVSRSSPTRRLRPGPRLLAGLVLVWTLVSWGGRIQLITAPEAGDPWALVRIGGSLLVGVATAVALWRAPDRTTALRWVFVVWTVVLWSRSLVVTWIDPPSIAFGLVHTVLAAGWAWLAWGVAPRSADRHRPAASSTGHTETSPGAPASHGS